MPTNPHPPETLSFIAQVEHAYASLMQFASPDSVPNSGGKLLYVGELNEPGRILATAGNISGAATLTASADATTLRQAMRNGTIDFVVNSLDEALRILKNEIRKREPVSVAVSLAPEAIAKEMLNRGVLPDLLPPLQASATESALATFIAQGAQRLTAAPLHPSSRFLIWQIPAEFAQHPAAFDELLAQHLPPHDLVTHRWLRQSPRYLGPQSRRLRSLTCDEATASKLIKLLGSPLVSCL
jgi:hypothetical protein